MNTKVLKIAFILSLFGMTFNSCQDEDIESTKTATEKSETTKQKFFLQIEDTTSYKPILSKKPIPQRQDFVYCYNRDCRIENATKYKTIKIRNIQGTIIQEWLYEDLRSDLYTHKVLPNDPNGLEHGYYYNWDSNLDDVIQSDWDEILRDAHDNKKKGFHIPNETDLNNLTSILGNSNKIPQYLNMKYDGDYNPWYDTEDKIGYNSHEAEFWLNPIDHEKWQGHFNGRDPNQKKGCGIIALWPINDHPIYQNSNGGLVIAYTNIQELHVKIRLVRTLKLNEW